MASSAQTQPLPHPGTEPVAYLRALYDTAVERALPRLNMASWLPEPPKGRTLVLGAGKAGGAMAEAVDERWPAGKPLGGLVITRYHHVPPAYAERQKRGDARIEVVEASHPVPDAAGLAATQRIAHLAQGLTADDLVIALISGGGSALLSLPAPGLTLADKQAINRALLLSGAAIDEMNCVRKHLSGIKGGRLAAMCHPAKVVTLTISDVPGDDPAVIASGPTVADRSNCADALDILSRYRIDLPPVALAGLRSAAFETPKPMDPRLAGHEVHLIATPRLSLKAAADRARAAGLAAHILGDDLEGESRVVGQLHATLARAVATHGEPFTQPCVLLSGGETTVTVKPQAPGTKRGRGGRAGEFLLGFAAAAQAHPSIHALAADTDGIDGVEDNAGGVVTPSSLQRAQALGLSLNDHLDRHDAYSWLHALGDLVVTGPTYTNVNDFRAVLIHS